MVCPITITKFVGTISLGLLTGISYNLTAITLPSLALLPTASSASRTLTQIQTATTRHVLTFASISSLSLITCYSLAGQRGRHPYLLWTALMAFLGGQGVEYYYNGLKRFPELTTGRGGGRARFGGVRSYVVVDEEEEEEDGEEGGSVNGEKVEAEMRRERKVQAVRALVIGVGFAMGVVGIWGDGA